MLTSNTMRFGTDYIDIDFAKMPRLKALIGGEIITVKTTDFKISSPSLVMRINGEKYYVRLVPITSMSYKTPLRLKINGKNYAVASTG